MQRVAFAIKLASMHLMNPLSIDAVHKYLKTVLPTETLNISTIRMIIKTMELHLLGKEGIHWTMTMV